MHEAHLVDFLEIPTLDDEHLWPRSLTWGGHDFLDAIRNDDVWSKTKSTVQEKVGSATFEVVKALGLDS